MEALINEGVDTIFGYPGGQIIHVFDSLYDYRDKLRHVLVRHEQGAIHAAQGYARAKGVPGVVIVTSGPGATNTITGVADAMIDSTPIVVITGQVENELLGTDAFQETDVVGMTGPIDKWTYQIRRPEDVAPAIAKAFYIASTGRPGPVVLDFTKDAQKGLAEYEDVNCGFIRSYVPKPKISPEDIEKAASLINSSKKPFAVYGQGILISQAEKELSAFLDKGGIPAGSTLLGLSALPSDFEHYIGMLGMHGNIAANMMTQECDLLIAVGMRFDNRVTGIASEYAPNAKVIHIDIDETEIGKIIPADVGIHADAKEALTLLTEKIKPARHDEWEASAKKHFEIENKKVIEPEVYSTDGPIHMGEVVHKVAEVTDGKAVIITDVGQNQMVGARYSRFRKSHSFISSGGLGTMGFGLPAAIGAKIGAPHKTVCLFVGDGGLQMTLQELGTIMQERTGVKIVLLNNSRLGNVRQFQELFFGKRYSETTMLNPRYALIAEAYGIKYLYASRHEELDGVINDMFSDDAPCLLEVSVEECGMVYPMVPSNKRIDQMLLNSEEWYDGSR